MIQWHIEITEWAPPVKLQGSVEGDSDVLCSELRSAPNKPFVLQMSKVHPGLRLGFSTAFFSFLSLGNEKVNFEKKINEMGN